MLKMFLQLLLLCLTAGAMGCVTGMQGESVIPPAAPLNISLNQNVVEQLDANLKELVRIYKKMQQISEGHFFYGSDEQLDIIQKSSLYILLSTRTTQHYNAMLPLLSNIRSDRQEEVAVLVAKSLEVAIFDLAHDLNFLNTFYALIENQAARENIDKSVRIIRDNLDLYKNLMMKLNEYSNSKQNEMGS